MRKMLLAIICLALLASTMCLAAEKTAKPSWWGKAPGPKPITKETMAKGTVANVSATSIAVTTPQGVKTFAIDPKTKVMIAGAKASIADVKTDMPVGVHFEVVNNVPTALRVVVAKARYKGEISAINGNSIILKSKQGEFHVIVTQATKFKSHGYEGSLSDLRVGYSAGAQGTIANNVMTADVVEFQPASAKGTVTVADANTITVKTIKQLNLALAPTAKTVVLVRPRVGPNVKGTMADVKVGSPVNIGFAPSKDGPSQLLWVDVLTGM